MVQLSRRLFSVVLVTGSGLAGWGQAISQATPLGSLVSVHAALSAANEVPPNKSSGTGTLEGTFNKETRVLNYMVSYSGLSGVVNGGHFHGPADAGATAVATLNFVDGMDSPIRGTAILTQAQAADLLAGKWYVNLHTAAFAGGEIRGQIEPR